MPDLDGFELAAMIREHPRFQKTAIIFVSAIHLTDMDRLRGYEMGAVDYVPVPVVPELLRAKVRVFADLSQDPAAGEAECGAGDACCGAHRRARGFHGAASQSESAEFRASGRARWAHGIGIARRRLHLGRRPHRIFGVAPQAFRRHG